MAETRLFVRNIPLDTTEQELQNEFGFYGNVKSVELKRKDDDNLFGFVNIIIEGRLIEKCIREFGQQKFKGNFLVVCKAKESFLERLKREREEALQPPQQAPSVPAYDEVEEEESSYHYQPLPTIQKEVSSGESSSEEEQEEIVQPQSYKTVLKPTNGFINSYDPPMDKASIDDMKRIESLQKLKNLHDEQKRAIKNALLSIDSVPLNTKIVFEPPEPRKQEQGQAEKPNNRKAQLFEDGNEEDEDNTQEQFKLRKQFAGKKGEKLFELQTRFQNDKRFKMDEKFADVDDSLDTRKKYTREELKERKKVRKEMANWDQNELKDEHDHQLSILEGITGESTGTLHSLHKPAQKGMLRFDPSKKEHLKYLDLVRGDEATDEMNRDESRANEHETFEVTDDKFYEVSEGLAQSLQQKTDTKPFSIFEMLGVNHEDEPDDDNQQPEEPKILTKLPMFHVNQAKFRYDSSDTDDEAEDKKSKLKKKVVQKKPNKGGRYSKSGIWRANFFIADGDERLKEAFAFIKTSDKIPTEEFDAKRKRLKQVIKSKIRKARSDQQKSTNSKKRKV